jgi:hypothetical protein
MSEGDGLRDTTAIGKAVNAGLSSGVDLDRGWIVRVEAGLKSGTRASQIVPS